MYGALRGEVQAKALQAQIAGHSSEIERSCSAWSAAFFLRDTAPPHCTRAARTGAGIMFAGVPWHAGGVGAKQKVTIPALQCRVSIGPRRAAVVC